MHGKGGRWNFAKGRFFLDQGGRCIVWRGGKFCFMPHWKHIWIFFRHWWRGLKDVHASLPDIFNKCYKRAVFLKIIIVFWKIYIKVLGGVGRWVNIFTCLRVVDFFCMCMVRGGADILFWVFNTGGKRRVGWVKTNWEGWIFWTKEEGVHWFPTLKVGGGKTFDLGKGVMVLFF